MFDCFLASAHFLRNRQMKSWPHKITIALKSRGSELNEEVAQAVLHLHGIEAEKRRWRWKATNTESDWCSEFTFVCFTPIKTTTRSAVGSDLIKKSCSIFTLSIHWFIPHSTNAQFIPHRQLLANLHYSWWSMDLASSVMPKLPLTNFFSCVFFFT